MALEKYLDHGETIQLRFGLGARYFGLTLLFWSLLFGGLIYFFQGNLFFIYPLITLWGLVGIYKMIIFFTTHYFVTNQKIYKKEGLLWQKVVNAKQLEVDDMQVAQGVFERFVFNTGTIKINTAGSTQFEVILTRVQDPYEMKKQITAIWNP